MKSAAPGYRRFWLAACALCALTAGCVEQTLDIQSDPPGALVYLNDQEVGRTPLKRDFKWYGDYDVQVRLEGYQTLRTHRRITAPIWNWVPLDLLANVLPIPFKDHQSMSFSLQPIDPALAQPAGLIQRSLELRSQLESGDFTRAPSTRPSTAPSTRPAASPAQ